MRRYLLSFPIDCFVKGGQYPSLPAHCTAVQTFYLEDEVLEEAIKRIAAIVGDQPPLLLKAVGRDYFGEKNDVPVCLIRPTAILADFHFRLLKVLYGSGGSLEKPDWSGFGYRPHISDVGERRFPAEGEAAPKELALVERLNSPKQERIIELFKFKVVK